MRSRALELQLAVALGLAAGCTGISLSGGSTGAGLGPTDTSAGGSTGAATTSTGGASTGTTSGSSTGSAVSSTGSASSSTTGAGAVTGSPPYQGFDSGPRNEPPIDPGCTALYPFGGDGFCAQCRDDGDCVPGWYCATTDTELPYQCYRCRFDLDGGAVGCSNGEVCDLSDVFPFCLPDCRVPDQGCPPDQHCDLDSGLCLQGCLDDGDCKDSGGICLNPDQSNARCYGCIPGDAGCPLGQLCDPSWQCEANCLDAGITCPVDSYCDSATGLCTAGCASDSDCGGDKPFCERDIVPHACAQCLTAADCPPGMQGCFRDQTRPTGTCGDCTSDSECPAPLTCGSACDCRKAADCAGFPSAPICAGLGGDGGSSFGLCGCRTNADCGGGFLCDPWLGESTAGSNYTSIVGGGLCVPDCRAQAATFCAGMYPGPICNSDTGLCGGCRSTSECDDNQACQNPLDAGKCVDPCTFVEGIDSCADAFNSIDVYCNTYTGLCQECLDDYDCTGIRDPMPGGFPALICSTSGACVQCTDASQCPADLPGCSFGSCGYCATAADCPANQGFVCARFWEAEAAAQCLLPCLPGDDAGLGSVSDAGPPCPPAQPFCVPAFGDAGTWCGACRFSFAANDCGTDDCCGTFCGPSCF